MSTIITRAVKGSELTWDEVDANFTNLNTDKKEAGSVTTLARAAISCTASGLTYNNATGVLSGSGGGGGAVSSVNGYVGDVNLTTTDLAIPNVENKSSATIRGELTRSNISTALGYLPPNFISVFQFMTDPEIADVQACTLTLDVSSKIQAAIDFSIYTAIAGKRGKIWFPAGVYRIDSPIQCGYGISFNSVVLQGEGRKYRTENGSNGFNGTGIYCNYSNAPALCVQGARTTIIRGMTIKGKNYDYIQNNSLGTNTPGASDLLTSAWVDPSLHANAASRYAPYAGVAVDPYSGNAPSPSYPTVTYPSALGSVPQYNKQQSSDVLLEDVEILGFVVGLAIKPSNSDGNADYVKMKSSSIECCVYGVSIGHTQSRCVDFDSVNITRVHTVITNRVHGLQNGKPQVSFRNCEFGSIIKILDLQLSLGGYVTFNSCESEICYSLGFCGSTSSGSASMIWNGGFFNMDSWPQRGVPAKWLDCGSTNGTYIFNGVQFSNLNGHPIHFGAPANCFSFNGCIMANYNNQGTVLSYFALAQNATCCMTFQFGTADLASFSVRLQSAWDLVTFGTTGAKVFGEKAVSDRNHIIPIYANNVRAASDTTDPGTSISLGSTWASSKSGMSITQDHRTATFVIGGVNDTNANYRGLKPGDILIDDETQSVFYIKSQTGTTIIADMVNNFDINNVPITVMTTAGTLYAQSSRRYTPTYVTYGTTTSGSTSVTSVGRDDGYNAYTNTEMQIGDAPIVNEYIDRFVSQDNSVVTASSAGSLTLTGTASKSKVNRLSLWLRKAPDNI